MVTGVMGRKEPPVSVRNALLALLEQGPRYGYQLRAEFEHRTGGTWPLNVGQVYTTLSRLERDGLVSGQGADGEGHVMYAVTDTGRQHPEFGGMRLFGSTIIFNAQNTPDAVTVSGAFIGPATAGSEPVKSTLIVSPDFRTHSRTEKVWSWLSPATMIPSPSKTSSNEASPSGSSRNAARIIVSE